MVLPTEPSYSGASSYAPPASSMSCTTASRASVGSGATPSSRRPPLSSISCFSSSLLYMILLSCLTSGLSLGQVPERLARLRISELRLGGEGIRPKGRAAHGVCEIDEHWKNHV